MSLTFPPQVLPVCPTPQSEKDELEVPAFLGGSKEFYQDPPQQSAASPPSVIKAAFLGDDSNQPVLVGLPSHQVAEEVVAAVIKNMFHHTPMEYIWDRILDRWVWRVTVG